MKLELKEYSCNLEGIGTVKLMVGVKNKKIYIKSIKLLTEVEEELTIEECDTDSVETEIVDTEIVDE